MPSALRRICAFLQDSKGQFLKEDPDDVDNAGVPYDYGSIMHYRWVAAAEVEVGTAEPVLHVQTATFLVFYLNTDVCGTPRVVFQPFYLRRGNTHSRKGGPQGRVNRDQPSVPYYHMDRPTPAIDWKPVLARKRPNPSAFWLKMIGAACDWGSEAMVHTSGIGGRLQKVCTASDAPILVGRGNRYPMSHYHIAWTSLKVLAESRTAASDALVGTQPGDWRRKYAFAPSD